MAKQRADTVTTEPEVSSPEPERGLAPRLLAAFEQSPISTVVYDSTGHPVAANASFERLWGASIDDVPPGYSVLEDPQLERAGILPFIRRAFAGEAVTTPPVRYEMAETAGRGQAVWTQAHLFPVRDEAGRVAQVVLTHEDITGRVQEQRSLAATVDRAERLQALTAALSMASTPREVADAIISHATQALRAAGVVVARLSEDGQQLIVMQVSPAPSALWEEWIRFPVSDGVPLADVTRTGEPVFLESRDEWEVRYPGNAAALEAASHHAHAVAPLIVDGRVLGALGIAFDTPREFGEQDRSLTLTIAHLAAQALERARLFDAERAARQEAEAANRAKGEFLAAMSHELRTPLNAIAGHVQLIEMELYGPVTPAQRDALNRVRNAQQYLLRHVTDVLNFARMQAGRLEFDLHPVDLAALVTELGPMIDPQLQSRSLRYSAAVEPGHIVLADREKLMQVLLNLLSNAVKFTAPGGTITVECVNRSDGTGVAGVVFLRVLDSGIGIPRDKWDAVFEPFVQVDATPAGRAAGAGLGLAISRDLVRGMGGDLRVRSTVGIGTAFTVTLPRA